MEGISTNNESNVKVYFNDLTTSHTASVLKEENHFYPYGLLMEGITPVVAANGSINKYKFSDSELQLELGLNQYDFSARFYDPVIGRFNVIDPFADFAANFTSYRYAFDNPVSYSDPSGLWEGEGGGDGDSDPVDVCYSYYLGGAINLNEVLVEADRIVKNDPEKGATDNDNKDMWDDEYNDREADDGDLDDEIVDDIDDEIAPGNGGYNIDNAVNWLNNNAHESWKDAKGKCAAYVRQALEEGGLNTAGHPVPAWQYSSFLPKLGFTTVNTTNFMKGDIAVIKGYPGATADPKTGIPYGHIEMFNGNQWISDFKQRDFWPGGGYRTNQPAFEIFRFGTYP